MVMYLPVLHRTALQQVRPLQLAVYCMNIANRGTQNRVTILKSIKDYSMSDTLYEHETEVLQE